MEKFPLLDRCEKKVEILVSSNLFSISEFKATMSHGREMGSTVLASMKNRCEMRLTLSS